MARKIVKPTKKNPVVRWNTPRGKLVGWKWANNNMYCWENGRYYSYALIKLEISSRAHVICAGGLTGLDRKRRASKAKVLGMWAMAHAGVVGEKITEARSWHADKFLYKVGKTVYPGRFSFNVTNRCAGGIHFFLKKSCALARDC